MSLQIALTLACLGYYVHPLVSSDKKPIAKHGYNDAMRDEAQIRAWWQETPRANIGINLHRSGLVDIAPDCQGWAERFEARDLPHTTRYTSSNAVAPGSIRPSGREYTFLTDLLPIEDLPLAPA